MIKSTLQSKSLLSWCLVPMTRNSVLSSFSSNLPSISHFFKSCMHPSIACSSSSCALWSSALKLRYSCVSSAKQWACGRWCSITLRSVEMQMTNSKGPRQEPWGMPQSSENCQESDPLMDTWWLRFDRYELNQSSTFPCMLTSLHSRSNKILRSTVSNAAFRSNRTIRVTCC